MSKYISKSILLLTLILIVGCALRFYKFDSPILDWHSWRQADTSSVTREFQKQGLDLFHPKYQDLSNVPSGLNNPQGYRFVEFPIYNLLQLYTDQAVSFLTLEESGRLVTITASALIILFIYLILARHANEKVALLSSLTYAILPFSIYYGRTILPDTLMIASVLAGVYFFDLYLNLNTSKTKAILLFITSLVLITSSILLKPYALIFLLPVIILCFNKFGKGMLVNYKLWIFLVVCILPFALWRVHMSSFPEGVPASNWLFNGGNIRFKGAYFYWIYADRLGRLILGYSGYFLFLLGIVSGVSVIKKKSVLFVYSFIIASVAYVTIIARGNVQHDYYQILIVPSIAMFVGIGSYFLLFNSEKVFNKYISIGVFIFSYVFMLIFSWYFIRDYFNINNPNLIIAGKAADSILPKDAKVLAPYGGDTSFLYQINRTGWASQQSNLSEMINLGTTHIVLVNPTQRDRDTWGKQYKTLASTDQYLIIELR